MAGNQRSTLSQGGRTSNEHAIAYQGARNILLYIYTKTERKKISYAILLCVIICPAITTINFFKINGD